MSFAGLRKAGDRAAIVAYMRSKSASPAPLPSPEELSEATPAEAESMVETVVEAVQEAAESAGEMAEEAAAAATEMAEEAAATVGAAAQAAGEAAEETMQSATEAVQEATTATEAATQPAAADGGGSGFAAQVASAEPALAKKVSRKCTACHTFEQGGKNKIGPNLYGVIGRNVAALDSFKYSNALKDRAGETWTYENLLAFLTKPKDWAPGNKMTFAGLRKEADRAAIIAFMRTYHDDPPALPE